MMEMMKMNSLILNFIGRILGYGHCRCGKSWLYANINNRGILKTKSTGKMLCTECYIRFFDVINEHNTKIMESDEDD